MENNKKAKQGKDNKNEMNIETKKESKKENFWDTLDTLYRSNLKKYEHKYSVKLKITGEWIIYLASCKAHSSRNVRQTYDQRGFVVAIMATGRTASMA